MKNKSLLRRILLLTALYLPLCGFTSLENAAAGGPKVKAVTYFGEEWPINFWSCEHMGMEADFRRIREDGFNSIILVVPWRQFQPSAKAPDTFDTLSLDKLNGVMDKAEAAGLSVILRVGYTWDFQTGDSISTRYRSLLFDPLTKSAWKSYAKKIYSTASSHANFGGAFLTWEDFWNYVEDEKYYAKESGIEEAVKIGYADYVRGKYSFEELTGIYQDQYLARDVPLKGTDSPAYRLFLEFYDDFLMKLLAETQQVFPGISLECRLDADPYMETDGNRKGYVHGATYGCGSSPVSSVMLSAAMGFGPGTVLSPKQAADKGETLIKTVSGIAGKPVFVDQFLYMETTPGYENLAKVKEDELGAYLSKIGKVFNASTCGYGLWTYRDYVDNILANPDFGYKLHGWTTTGSVDVQKTADRNHRVRLGIGGSISQDLSGRFFLSDKNTTVEFTAIPESSTEIFVTVGSEKQSVKLDYGEQRVRIEFKSQQAERFTIQAVKPVVIDDIKVFTHETRGRIYNMHGEAEDLRDSLRVLNSLLN